ncbi:MAG TPA: MMPL family transporter [Solirubrobacteraceae bacterium]|nr:MMPL family transporter [Solirubrobacteraceae bacterium]
MFLAWIALVGGGMAAGLPDKFTEAEENTSTSFLPEDAESTRALQVTERLQDGEVAPAVVVYRRAGGLTPADRREIARDLGELNRISARHPNTTPFSPPQFSRDGTAALLRNEIRESGDDEEVEPVEDYREAVSAEGRAPEGLEVKVGGPAGAWADFAKVGEGIDGRLLGTAVALVIVLLILIYRSPTFWFFPILAVAFAEIATQSLGYGLTELGVTVNGQSSSIMSVLVIGAGTDYALLLVARYREELRRHEDQHEAMQIALRRAGPAIVASGLTVSMALLVLMLAKVNGTAGLGPTGALGVTVAIVAMITFLPALLTIVGRRPFWPLVPFGPGGAARGRVARRFAARTRAADETHGAWRRVGEFVAARPARVGLGGLAVLAAMALGLLNFSTGLTSSDRFTGTVESEEAQDLIARAFPGGAASPTEIVVRSRADAPRVAAAAARVPGVAEVSPEPVAAGPPGAVVAAFLEDDPFSRAAYDVIPRLRDAVRAAAPGALVGGRTAVEADLRDAAGDDTRTLIPLATVVVLLILVVLLRALVAPVLLILTVIASLLAALGVGAVVFDVVFGFPGSEPSLPLFAFIFLVALGVDYNIFLMARVREEALRSGTRDGMLRGLAVTGGVITSAGVVLAGTFAVLGVMPLIFLTQIGFVVAFGVLLDTFLVRSVLVPALAFSLGPRIWWPSRLEPSPAGVAALAPLEREAA